MIRYEFTVAALAATRFGWSPLLEVRNALRVLHPLRRSDHPVYAGWRPRTLAALADSTVDLALLHTFVAPSGYVPGFLAPAPPPGTPPELSAELSRVCATDAATVVRHIHEAIRVMPHGTGKRRADRLRGLAENPEEARDRAVVALESFWQVALQPIWPGIQAVLDRDIAVRSAQLAQYGPAAAFDALHPGVRWQAGTLITDRPASLHVRVDDRGMVLLPSVFAADLIGGAADPELQATLTYRARGTAELWSLAASAGPRHDTEPPAGLVRTLGLSRTRILVQLDSPLTTTQLAEFLRLAAGNVSTHLTALRGAGLVASHRRGHRVLYARTVLADQLLTAARPGSP
ncbi:winged helix-turn-helix domain-containing protein [Fodinicola acaciae]|uniref:winged helix-turn-helix domain-containing protein n=1 Tax=Fodinicola acaciae TaxID=2681555 RepID=UPI0013D13436|nr:winged helix-turn-helix domain-containing protein [Fodinicola acaciae]